MTRCLISIFLFICVLATSSYSFAGNKKDKPDIIAQKPLSTNEGQSITIALTDLTVIDFDNFYPLGFSLEISSGNYYSVSGSTIFPDQGFSGTLVVPVRVNDGESNSKWFDLNIQVINTNYQPVITSQVPLSISQNQSITIQLSQLTVSDNDNSYPGDFTLVVLQSNSSDYTVSGNTVTPAYNFSGTLNVPVVVNDGNEDSEPFNLQIQVADINDKPVITGQVPLNINEGQSITIQLSQLTVTDPDNTYPDGFTLSVSDGSNYSVSGNTVTPAYNFTGTLNVPVVVNDGNEDSEPFNLQIQVADINDKPVITGQVPLNINEGQSITIQLSQLTVTDPDNTYPGGFTLNVSDGSNYSVTGSTVTPFQSFTGTLNVLVTVNDGNIDSEPFNLQIQVNDINDQPVITGQLQMGISENQSATILLTHLMVVDPDNNYPNDFTLNVLAGANYTVSGHTITPRINFTGTLLVNVTVNDGMINSKLFAFEIEVLSPNKTPVVAGQIPVAISEDQSITLQLSQLTILDSDNTAADFNLNILSGTNYTLAGNTVTPIHNFNGNLIVIVTVSDGTNKSAPFNMQVLVNPVNDPPEITTIETDALSYALDNGPLSISQTFEVIDVDDDSLAYAEIGIRSDHYKSGSDELLFQNKTNIRGTFDGAAGILLLIGKASVHDYQEAIRSVQYKYSGSPVYDVLQNKTIYIDVNDGKDLSEVHERLIVIKNSFVDLDIPTGFTPNGDLANDTWRIKPVGSTDRTRDPVISVYSKTGKLVFETVGYDKEWDGRFNGEILPADSYYYTIDLNLPANSKILRGIITILR